MPKRIRAANRPWRGAVSNRQYTENTIQAAAPVWRRCLRAFAAWLEEVRGLALSSITVRVASARAFVEALEGRGGVWSLRLLRVSSIEDFFVDYAQACGPAARRSMQAALRLFLRYAVLRKWARHELANAVPSLRTYRLSTVPRGLAGEAVRTLVTSPLGSARARALLLLFATYGVRRGQVCTLRLEDLDWRNKTVTFAAHKGGKAVTQVLTPAVATQLAKYLQHERPVVDTATVFVRARRPYLPLSPSAVTASVQDSLRRAGIKATPHGPHALRHAFATRLLQRGQPLKVIADLLGHRSLDAVSIYAKVDHPHLLEVAAEWPEVTS